MAGVTKGFWKKISNRKTQDLIFHFQDFLDLYFTFEKMVKNVFDMVSFSGVSLLFLDGSIELGSSFSASLTFQFPNPSSPHLDVVKRAIENYTFCQSLSNLPSLSFPFLEFFICISGVFGEQSFSFRSLFSSFLAKFQTPLLDVALHGDLGNLPKHATNLGKAHPVFFFKGRTSTGWP